MSLKRHLGAYTVFGLIQLAVDWALTVMLSHFGLRIGLANIIGRVGGAWLGYWLNGRYTFAGEEPALGRQQFARYVTWWCTATVLSTIAIELIDDDLGRKWAWLAKPLVEGVLAGVSFMVSRHWVFRR
ncbi:MAG: GtrA family protein [Pseudoxanthomonas suwonensis]|nr:GtrA family protein [Pseudoxanthomonas suwonensis]